VPYKLHTLFTGMRHDRASMGEAPAQSADSIPVPGDIPFLRDTVSVPFFDNHMTAYPSVRLRMDFRDPNTVGTFVYHCHLLEHEDGGMMLGVKLT